MARFVDADKLSEQITTEYCGKCGIYNGELCCSCPMNDALRYIDDFPAADVAPRAEVFEAVDKFRADLMHRLIDLCGGNDYNKLTLLKIDDVVCKVYDTQIAELKQKCTDATDTIVGGK